MEVKNGIIIDGVLHELVREEYENTMGCSNCSLHNTCRKYSIHDRLCDINGDGDDYNFVNRGKVKVEKKDVK